MHAGTWIYKFNFPFLAIQVLAQVSLRCYERFCLHNLFWQCSKFQQSSGYENSSLDPLFSPFTLNLGPIVLDTSAMRNVFSPRAINIFRPSFSFLCSKDNKPSFIQSLLTIEILHPGQYLGESLLPYSAIKPSVMMIRTACSSL